MIYIAYLIAIGFGFAVFARNIFSDTLTWQQKEYRRDRMLAWIKYESSSKFRGWQYLAVYSLFILSNVLIWLFGFEHYVIVINSISIVLFCLICLSDILLLRFKKPKISIRNFLILIFSVFVAVILISIFLLIRTASLIVFDDGKALYHLYTGFLFTSILALFIILTPILTTTGVALTAPLSYYKKKKLITQAQTKLSKLTNLKIIGITGSFGKTTTKELLAKILESKYSVKFSPANINTAVGIAQVVLNDIDEKTEIFIAEMGTYAFGEIKEITDFCPPDIAIVTTVGDNHIDLLGSRKNIQKAKFEIIEGLKPKGIAILNAQNKYTREMADMTNHEVRFFGEAPDIDTLTITEIVDDEKIGETHFTINYQNHSQTFELSVQADHILQNLLPAILASIELGFEMGEIAKVLNHKSLTTSHFNIIYGKNNTLIDNSYNTNPQSFEASLALLNKQKHRQKIIITRGILELRSILDPIYQKLAQEIQNTATAIITTDALLGEKLKTCKNQSCIIHIVKNDNEIEVQLGNLDLNDATILIEGRIHPKTYKFIRNLIV